MRYAQLQVWFCCTVGLFQIFLCLRQRSTEAIVRCKIYYQYGFTSNSRKGYVLLIEWIESNQKKAKVLFQELKNLRNFTYVHYHWTKLLFVGYEWNENVSFTWEVSLQAFIRIPCIAAYISFLTLYVFLIGYFGIFIQGFNSHAAFAENVVSTDTNTFKLLYQLLKSRTFQSIPLPTFDHNRVSVKSKKKMNAYTRFIVELKKFEICDILERCLWIYGAKLFMSVRVFLKCWNLFFFLLRHFGHFQNSLKTLSIFRFRTFLCDWKRRYGRIEFIFFGH